MCLWQDSSLEKREQRNQQTEKDAAEGASLTCEAALYSLFLLSFGL